MRKLALIGLFLLILFVCFACLWTGKVEDYYFHAASGLLNKWICWPILIFLIIYTVFLCIRKFHTTENLYFGAGVLFTISITLGLYVANSGMAIFSCVGMILLAEGRELKKLLTSDTNLTNN